jgi:hypothetical protein
MTYSVEGIPINTQTLMNAYKMWYPLTYQKILEKNKFHYLYLWGIRVSSCDTSLPDDIMGGLRVNRLNMLELVVSKASTDPSPKNITQLYDAEAIAKGGAAYVKEGEHQYYYYGTNHPRFKPLPAFAPVRPIPVYRWKPNNNDLKNWKGRGTPLTSSLEIAKREGRVKNSTSTDVLIHRSWGKEKLWADSAGCQVITNDNTLRTLGTWATNHRSMKYPNLMTYTLFTKEQFVAANRNASRTSTTNPNRPPAPSPTGGGSLWDTIFNIFKR